ncbi:uncharacterized protein PFL1_06605 [Pseudozyma flocculosa PF-1]|uniref:DUF6604 domain-containing protein n=2 Tax=Pseudozyma flocculosa TaxID=84751 RepID=A0A5C3F7W2_9BASI|nr:uncharacterized protein PFL1_06605 [Pseudozyma flocculosa PF-1]EPQ25931.1 hypothetical protein PFL1_06605 [Pseudozyma flocculosa PF-1]SPO40568.1 uncharacterized protein PSFLO_06050 [Pseudozyma flocculosa]
MDGYVSNYWLYKRDTDRCASWLATTALSLGFPRKRFLAAKADLRKNLGSRGTGSDRCTKAGGGGGATPNPPAQQYRYILKTCQLVELAQFIADKGHAVPVDKLALVRRCLSRRLACLKFYEGRSPICTKHSHFVNVLAEVIRILQPFEQSKSGGGSGGDGCVEAVQQSQPDVEKEVRAKKRGKRGKARAKASSAAEAAETSVDVTIDDLVSQLHLCAIDAEGGGDDKYEAETEEPLHFRVESDVNEALVAFMAFYADLRDVRRYLEHLWNDFRHHRADLVTASLTTNAAFELVERVHQDVVERYSSLFSGPKDLIETLAEYAVKLRTGNWQGRRDDAAACCDPSGGTGNSGSSGSSSVDAEEAVKEAWSFVAEHLCLLPFSLASDWQETRADSTSLPSLFLLFDDGAPGRDVAALSSEERRQLAVELVWTTLADFATFDSRVVRGTKLADGEGRIPDFSTNSADAFTRDVCRFIRSGRDPSLLLAFELQVYVDINCILQYDNRRGRVEARFHLRQARRSLEEAVANECKPNLCEHHRRELSASIRSVRNYLHELQLRNIHAPQAAFADEEAWSPAIRIPLLDRHPTFCGLQAYRGLKVLRETGANESKCSDLALAGIHLYNVCRGALACDGPAADALSWPDAELVVELHGVERLFDSSRPPTTLEEARRSALKACGYPKQLIDSVVDGSSTGDPLPPASDKRSSSEDESGDRFAFDSAFFSAFDDTPCPCPRHKTAWLQFDLDEGKLQRLLAEAEARQLPAAQEGSHAGDGGVDIGGDGAAAEAERTETPMHREGSKTKRAPWIAELLAILAEGLGADMPQLCFDYVAFNTRCSQVFEALYATLADERESLGASEPFPHSCKPLQVVCEMMSSMLWCRFVAQSEQPGIFVLHIVEKQHELLARVARVMRAKLADVGADAGCRQLHALQLSHVAGWDGGSAASSSETATGSGEGGDSSSSSNSNGNSR